MVVKKNKDLLIYDLIFSNTDSFIIDIADYIDDIYHYEIFISEIKKVLKKSKVKISSSSVIVDSKTVTWKLKVSK
jgi:hypothetical protein